MCARYELNASTQNIIERFGLTAPNLTLTDLQLNTEIRPTNAVPIISGDSHVEILRWGLDVPWQKQPVINARIETVESKPTFQPLLNQRVLIPATAYFEWRKDARTKVKTRIALADAGLFTMAGFCSGERFVILTCTPAPGIAHIHSRMPVLMPRTMEADWINPDVAFEDMARSLGPFNGELSSTEEAPPPRNQGDLFS